MDIEEAALKIESLPEKQREILAKQINSVTRKMKGLPTAGPQLEAYFSKADVLLFGGCVSADTEFLTDRGWKPISEYAEGDMVGQWDQGTKALSFVTPDAYTKAPCSSLIHFRSSRMSMVLSDEHRMPLYNWDGKFIIKNAADVASRPSKYKIPTDYKVDRPGIQLTETELRLAVAVHADGNLYISKNGSAQCRMSLRKERKKERLLSYLKALDIEPHIYINANRPTEVRYGFTSPVATKKYDGFWWDASQKQLEIILDEISYWDGDIAGTMGGDICYTSVNKCDVDFIQYAAHSCGRIANIAARSKKKENHKVQYRINISHDNSVKSCSTIRCDTTKISRESHDWMYCFTVPTTFWLARHNNKIFVTGNSPGGGKSVLGILLALNEHYRSLHVRSAFTDLRSLIDTAKKIVGSEDGFVGGSRPMYKKENGGVCHFMGLADDGGVGSMQGEDHDLIHVDEGATCTEEQVRLIMGWLRTDREGQRCRVVISSNPPLDSTGDWLCQYFAPWLDDKHPNPARPGELRWFLPTQDGPDIEANQGDFTFIEGIQDRHGNPVKIHAESRTFIPSKFSDNPYYSQEEYAKRLAGLSLEARNILATGNFMAERTDSIWQLIPTAWVKAAVQRWHDKRPTGIPMSAVGVDIAQGGADDSVTAQRWDYWYDKLQVVPGSKTPEGADIAAMVVKVRRDAAQVTADMGGGYGGPAKLALLDNGIEINEYKGAEESTALSREDKLAFASKRVEIMWRLREEFDPSQPGGAQIAIPPDNDLVSQLTAIRFKESIRQKGRQCIRLETAEETKKRFGKSLDRAYAVALCNWKGPKNITPNGHPARRGRSVASPKINLGYSNRKANRRH